ncbi:MAG TPA: hypothetical protein P5298_04950 [Spirochaetia bacterium]|nr:hypothetical protein [Spirochaetia bacterium]
MATMYDNDIRGLFAGSGFEFAVSMDCEGTNYDKNLDANVDELERFVAAATAAGVTTVLFVTPRFAEALERHGLAGRLPREYRVVYGLHIHPDNLPDEMESALGFIRPDEEYLASYTEEQQRAIISSAYAYVLDRGVGPLQIFRGGCFSMGPDTSRILAAETPIRFESHNPFREQYRPEPGLLDPLPVYALSRDEELRLEFFTTERLEEMVRGAIRSGAKTLAITHSYMLDPNDFHYRRDGIEGDIHVRLARLLAVIAEAEAGA